MRRRIRARTGERHQLALGDHVLARQRQPVVEDRRVRGRGRRDDERRALDAGPGRVAEQLEGQPRQALAELAGVCGPALVRGPGAGLPVRLHEQVGERGRRQDRLVPARRQVEPALRPAEPAGQLRVRRDDVRLGRVAQREGEVARGRPVGVLRVHLEPAGGLDVPQPQPGRRPEVDRVDHLLGEAEVLAGRSARGEGLAEVRGDAGEGADARRLRFEGEVAAHAGLVRRDERCRVRGRLGRAGRRLRLGDELADGVGVGHRAPDHAGARAAGGPVRRDDRDRPRRHLAVGGQRAVGPAQVRLGAVGDDDDGAVGGGGREGGLDDVLG